MIGSTCAAPDQSIPERQPIPISRVPRMINLCSPHISPPSVARHRKRAWIQGARRSDDRGVLEVRRRRPTERNAGDRPVSGAAAGGVWNMRANFDSRQVRRQALAWLLLLLIAAGPAAAQTAPGGTPSQASGASGGPPRDQGGAPVPPAPPPAPPPPPPGPPLSAPVGSVPGATPPPSTTPAPGTPAAAATAEVAPAPAAAGPAGAVGGLAPSADRTSVDVLQLNPEVGELHLDIANNVLSLTLDQAVEIALRRNLALILQRYIRNEARDSVLQALGIYDLNLTGLGRASASAAKNPPPNQGTASKSSGQEVKVGLAQLLPTGGNVGFIWDNPRGVQS